MISGPVFVRPDPIWTSDLSTHPVSCLDYNNDGDSVAYSNRPGELVVRHSMAGTPSSPAVQFPSPAPLTGCSFHPSTQNLIYASTHDGYISVYDHTKSESVATVRNSGSRLLGMAMDSFGDTFAVGSDDGSIRIHTVGTLQRTKVLVPLTQHQSNTTVIYALKYHPVDGNVILTAHGHRIAIWDIRTGASERGIAGLQIRGPCVAIHNNTIYTASCREFKQIEVWDYGTMKKIKDIPFDPPGAKPSPLTAISVSRNGVHLVAGGGAATAAQVFDSMSGASVGWTKNFAAPITGLAMSPFGCSFVVGTENGNAACHVIRVKA
jgi:WD40 repeat protein